MNVAAGASKFSGWESLRSTMKSKHSIHCPFDQTWHTRLSTLVLGGIIVLVSGCWTNVPYDGEQSQQDKADDEVKTVQSAPAVQDPAANEEPSLGQAQADSRPRMLDDTPAPVSNARVEESPLSSPFPVDVPTGEPSHDESFFDNVAETENADTEPVSAPPPIIAAGEDIFANVKSRKQQGTPPANDTAVATPVEVQRDESDEPKFPFEPGDDDAEQPTSDGSIEFSNVVPNPFDAVAEEDTAADEQDFAADDPPSDENPAATDDTDLLTLPDEPPLFDFPDAEDDSADDEIPAFDDQPAPISNTKQAAWVLGERLGQAVVADDMDTSNTHFSAAQEAASILGIELPELPPQLDEASSANSPRVLLGRLLPLGQNVGALVAANHGVEHVATFEFAYKANLLLVLHNPELPIAESIRDALGAAAQKSALPSRLWEPSLQLLADRPDQAKIDRFVGELYRTVGEFLAEPDDSTTGE
jgi:hypothetical protein